MRAGASLEDAARILAGTNEKEIPRPAAESDEAAGWLTTRRLLRAYGARLTHERQGVLLTTTVAKASGARLMPE